MTNDTGTDQFFLNILDEREKLIKELSHALELKNKQYQALFKSSGRLVGCFVILTLGSLAVDLYLFNKEERMAQNGPGQYCTKIVS